MNLKQSTLSDFPNYIFYSDGGVYDLEKCKYVKVTIKEPCGYNYIRLNGTNTRSKEYRHHILICRAFNGEKPLHNSVVGHLNNIKTDNRAENLYWTTTKENSRKSFEDGCSVTLKGDENDSSVKIKVLDSQTYDILGVYGSIKECVRMVENVTDTFIASVYNKGIYKTRSKKYIYTKCTDDEYNSNHHLKQVKLQDNPKVDKRPVLFEVTFLKTGVKNIYDNQTRFSKEFGLPQAIISKAIKSNGTIDDMRFKKLKKLDVKNSTMYESILENVDEIRLVNIFTNEEMVFKTIQEVKDYFDLRCNDFRGTYLKNGHLIHSEWKVIE